MAAGFGDVLHTRRSNLCIVANLSSNQNMNVIINT